MAEAHRAALLLVDTSAPRWKILFCNTAFAHLIDMEALAITALPFWDQFVTEVSPLLPHFCCVSVHLPLPAPCFLIFAVPVCTCPSQCAPASPSPLLPYLCCASVHLPLPVCTCLSQPPASVSLLCQCAPASPGVHLPLPAPCFRISAVPVCTCLSQCAPFSRAPGTSASGSLQEYQWRPCCWWCAGCSCSAICHRAAAAGQRP